MQSVAAAKVRLVPSKRASVDARLSLANRSVVKINDLICERAVPNTAVRPDHDLPARGKSHPMTFSKGSLRNLWSGSRRLLWNLFCCAAFFANATTCSSPCRLSFGRAIHSRIIFRRVSWSFIFAVPWATYLGQQGAPAHDLRSRQVCRASYSAAVKCRQRVAASTRTPG
jgi:hypothetical protein